VTDSDVNRVEDVASGIVAPHGWDWGAARV
jgi:hypothetical protein